MCSCSEMTFQNLKLIFTEGPKDHINIRISHSGSKDQHEGDTKKHTVMWSFGALLTGV